MAADGDVGDSGLPGRVEQRGVLQGPGLGVQVQLLQLFLHSLAPGPAGYDYRPGVGPFPEPCGDVDDGQRAAHPGDLGYLPGERPEAQLGPEAGDECGPGFLPGAGVPDLQVGPGHADIFPVFLPFHPGAELGICEDAVGVSLSEGDCLLELHEVVEGGAGGPGDVVGSLEGCQEVAVAGRRVVADGDDLLAHGVFSPVWWTFGPSLEKIVPQAGARGIWRSWSRGICFSCWSFCPGG